MQLDPRTSQILFILLEAKHPISVDQIATQLSISRRTLYRELKNMTPVLEAWHLKMETIAGQGISLIGADADREGLLTQIQQSDAFDPRNRKARQTLLAALLLRQTSPSKILAFASALQVSESTISNDLQDLEAWFDPHHLEICKRPGYGIDLAGEEKDFRLACLHLAQELRENDFMERIRQHKDSEVFHLLDQKWFYQLYELLQETRQEVPLHITEGSQTILLTYLTIACQRMAAGHMLEGIQECWQDDVIVRQDQTLSDLLKRMENAFSLSITQAEASAIHIYLKGAKPRYLDKDTDFLQEDTELTGLIREMLGCFAPSVRLYLERDPEFFQALAAHLRPALVRMEHNIQVDNPFLYEVQQTYPDLYQKAVYAGQVIHQRLGYEVPDNEIGLLAVHFGGALFRYDQTYKPRRLVRIAVVCSSGIGISRLLTAQLQNAFAGKVKLCTYGEAFEDNCVLPYEGSYYANASLAEPMSCIIGTYHAMYHTTQYVYEHRMGIRPGGKLALLGCGGPMGIGAIDYAVHGPIQPGLVVVVDMDEARLSRAAALIPPEQAAAQGIQLVYLNTRDIDGVAALQELAGGKGYDDVFVFAPVGPLVEMGDAILGNDGCLNFFAGPTDHQFKVPFNFYNVHYEGTHIVGTSGGSPEDMLESLRLSQEGKINPSFIPPIYFRLPEYAIAQYWNDISAAAPNTDFVIYNIPQLAGVALTMNLFAEMRKNPRVIGVKNSSMPVQDIQMFKQAGGADYIIFNGPDEQFISGRVIGAEGAIGGTYGVMPDLFLKRTGQGWTHGRSM